MSRGIAIVVRKTTFEEAGSDFGDWQAQSLQKRLEALEAIRDVYHLERYRPAAQHLSKRRETPMAVITRYVVVRNGVEYEPVFTDKKKAEAYDRMLEAAEQLAAMIHGADLHPPVDAATVKAIAVYLAENAPRVTAILKGVKPVAALEQPSDAGPAEQPVQTTSKSSPRSGKTKSKGA